MEGEGRGEQMPLEYITNHDERSKIDLEYKQGRTKKENGGDIKKQKRDVLKWRRKRMRETE